MPNKPKKQEVKYDPNFFVDDLINIFSMLVDKLKLINEIEFTLKQKAEITGLIVGTANIFVELNDKLKEWGFVR